MFKGRKVKKVGENKYGNMVYVVINADGSYWFIERRLCREMPFDRWDQYRWCFIHATGYEWFNWAWKRWEVEYEDSTVYELIMGAA